MRKRVTQRSQIANCAFRMLTIESDLPLGPTKSHKEHSVVIDD